MAETKPNWNAFLFKTAGAIVALLLAALGGWLANPPRIKIVNHPAVVEDDTPPAKGNGRYAQGWIRDDDEVKAVARGLRFPVFGDTPAGQVGDVPDRVYLWEIAKQALGEHVPTRDQGGVGSCVAVSSAGTVDYQQCVQMVAAKKAGQPPPEFKSVSAEVIYGGSRQQIGQGRVRGDGSVGAWAAEWNRQYGAVAMGKYEGYDLSEYSESTCRTFGNRGCPKSLEAEAKKHPTKTISQVKTVAEAKRAIASGYPVTVASDVGFGSRGPYTRNQKGQLRASGQWAHQMFLIGYDRGSGFCVMNSWGKDWVKGPAGPGDPPPGSFWIEEATAQRMFSQDDSWAYGDQVGFPARRVDDWFLRAPAPRRPFETLFALAP